MFMKEQKILKGDYQKNSNSVIPVLHTFFTIVRLHQSEYILLKIIFQVFITDIINLSETRNRIGYLVTYLCLFFKKG